MMSRSFFRSVLALLALVALLATSAVAAATPYTVRSGVDCSKASDSTVCQSVSTEDPITGTTGILNKVTNLIAIIAGVAAVIIMILAGIRYITSNGDAEAVSRAKKTIIFAAAGLVVIVVARQIIYFVIARI